MERHRFLRLATAVLVTLTLAASTALATPSSSYVCEQFRAFLPGINCDGHLNWPNDELEDDWQGDGDLVNFWALVNTQTGKFCFKVCGRVVNESCHCQFYCDRDLIVFDVDDNSDNTNGAWRVCRSTYCVSKPCRCISFVTYAGIAIDYSEGAP